MFFRIIIVCVCTCLASYVYAKKHLLIKIKNGTKNIVFMYVDWDGCGVPFFWVEPKSHHDRITLRPNQMYSFKKRCVDSDNVSITPILDDGKKLRITINYDNRTIASLGDHKFDWMKGLRVGGNFTAVLKYKRDYADSIHGYYWTKELI